MSRKQWLPDRAIGCAIAGLIGWIVSETLATLFQIDGSWFGTALTCSLVAGAMGMGINSVERTTNETWNQLVERITAGFIIGGLTGAISGSLGNFFSQAHHGPWLIGWALMGLGLGSVEGLYQRSPARLRIGLVGGSVGGLVGGFLFERIYWILAPWSVVAGRATGFVVFGLCLGGLIELAKVGSCRAWLTVLDGDRPGRTLRLSGSTAVLGKAKCAALSFLGTGNNTVDQEHARIVPLGDGRFALEDNHSRHGTTVNLARVLERIELKDGDLIRIGPNSIRFNERKRKSDGPVDSRKSSAAAPPPARIPEPTVASHAQPAPGSSVGGSKATATPKPPRPAEATPTRSKNPLPRGTTRCPTCQRLVTGSRPYCVNCKMAL